MNVENIIPRDVKTHSSNPQSCGEKSDSLDPSKERECPTMHSTPVGEPDVPEILNRPAGATADFLFIDSMLNHLAKSHQAPFKSQQVGDPDLDFSEKKEIARDILKENPARFLEKFGRFLLEDHLDYFSNEGSGRENYEIDFHVKQLKRFHSKSKSQVDVRNRRFEALKKLIEGGEYFSEEEMMKRNPLMYEQLVGQYLTVEEKQDRYQAANTKQSRSYVMHLMGQIENHYVNCLRKQQQEDEEAEEMDTSDEEGDQEHDSPSDYKDCSKNKDLESDENVEEFDSSDDSDGEAKELDQKIHCGTSTQNKRVSDEEKDLLREEFFNNMYESFLEGRDVDFDYSKVDSNPEYECLAVRSQDEEEQYFDSETPELIKSGSITPADNEIDEEEDELDKFMKNLNSGTCP